jgi:hypothetical protein
MPLLVWGDDARDGRFLHRALERSEAVSPFVVATNWRAGLE